MGRWFLPEPVNLATVKIACFCCPSSAVFGGTEAHSSIRNCSGLLSECCMSMTRGPPSTASLPVVRSTVAQRRVRGRSEAAVKKPCRNSAESCCAPSNLHLGSRLLSGKELMRLRVGAALDCAEEEMRLIRACSDRSEGSKMVVASRACMAALT